VCVSGAQPVPHVDSKHRDDVVNTLSVQGLPLECHSPVVTRPASRRRRARDVTVDIERTAHVIARAAALSGAPCGRDSRAERPRDRAGQP
jgi:hypothetical protein